MCSEEALQLFILYDRNNSYAYINSLALLPFRFKTLRILQKSLMLLYGPLNLYNLNDWLKVNVMKNLITIYHVMYRCTQLQYI